MPHRIARGQVHRPAIRRTFVATVLGTSPGETVRGLKKYLHAATLTPSPEDKLELVMLEDYDHLAEMIAAHGQPLSRNDPSEVEYRPRRTVTLPRRRFIALLWGASLLVPGPTIVTVALEWLGCVPKDILPW